VTHRFCGGAEKPLGQTVEFPVAGKDDQLEVRGIPLADGTACTFADVIQHLVEANLACGDQPTVITVRAYLRFDHWLPSEVINVMEIEIIRIPSAICPAPCIETIPPSAETVPTTPDRTDGSKSEEDSQTSPALNPPRGDISRLERSMPFRMKERATVRRLPAIEESVRTADLSFLPALR
jgi:hypothetical protein